MAIQKSILKNTRQEYVVHLFGSAAADTTSIALTDLVRSDETTSGTLLANIQNFIYCCSGSGTIALTRGVSSIAVLSGGTDTVDYSGIGMGIGNHTAVTVTFNTPGWIILTLHKKDGYVEPLSNKGV